jgi:putative transposase
MPRKPRFFLPGIPSHVIQCGNNRQSIFFIDNDYQVYLGWLGEAARRWGCEVHAYVLMTNHMHLLVTAQAHEALSRMMQYVGRHYVPYVNAEYRHSGTLWEGRIKASLVQALAYLLTCYRYIELNPVRVAVVNALGDYPWSSYRCNALGHADLLVVAHAEYRTLGSTPEERQATYRGLFAETLDPGMMAQLRACALTGPPFGNDRFREEIEHALGRRVGFSRRGRPRRTDDEDAPPAREQIEIPGL